MGCHSSKTEVVAEPNNCKTAHERKVAWQRIRAALPRSRTPEAKLRRIELFKEFDKNECGKLTLNEAYDGCVNILHLDEFTPHLHDIVKRAFDKAKSMGNIEANTGSADYVEFLEFRLMLCYIYDYFELTVMFDEIDTSGNMLIDKEEFEKAVPKIAEWGLHIDDAEAVFKQIDANCSGSVTFDEFARWATAKHLDADGDPDNEKEE